MSGSRKVRYLLPFVRLLVLSSVAQLCSGQLSGSGAHSLRAVTLASQSPVPTFHRNVDLVVIPVTVLNRKEQAVSGLTADHFRVLDDRAQTIKYFSKQDEPIALAVVVDASDSMAGRFEDVQYATQELIKASNPQDEFSVIVVGDTPRIALDHGESPDEFSRALEVMQPRGQTALWDSMLLAVQQMRSARLERRAMVVITDGGDNHSRTSDRELKVVLKEAGVAVYAIALYNAFAMRAEEKRGPLLLSEQTSATGGRVISVRDRAEILRAVSQIGRELREQYVLGYYPPASSKEGKWHKVKVSLNARTTPKKYRVFAKQGYFRSSE